MLDVSPSDHVLQLLKIEAMQTFMFFWSICRASLATFREAFLALCGDSTDWMEFGPAG
jgi:hypothetical protein